MFDWQIDVKYRPLIFFGKKSHIAAVHFHDIFNNVKSKSRSHCFFAHRVFASEKFAENLILFACRNANARIFDPYFNIPIGRFYLRRDNAFRRRIFYRIINYIFQSQADFIGVNFNVRQNAARDYFQFYLFFIQFPFKKIIIFKDKF